MFSQQTDKLKALFRLDLRETSPQELHICQSAQSLRLQQSTFELEEKHSKVSRFHCVPKRSSLAIVPNSSFSKRRWPALSLVCLQPSYIRPSQWFPSYKCSQFFFSLCMWSVQILGSMPGENWRHKIRSSCISREPASRLVKSKMLSNYRNSVSPLQGIWNSVQMLAW